MSPATDAPSQDTTHPGQAGRFEVVVDRAAWLTDAIAEIAEALVMAVIGGMVGAGRTAQAIWIADRPRRQEARRQRRGRWFRRRGWWRVAVILELLSVGAWMGGRAAYRVVRGVPGGAADGAREGWGSGRDRARERARARRHGDDDQGFARRDPDPPYDWGNPDPMPAASTSPGKESPGNDEQIVDAEILCSRAGCGTALAPDDPQPLCPACRAARPAADDVQVTVEITPDPAAATDEEISPDPWPPVTAEQAAARRLAGDGPLDVADPDTWITQAMPTDATVGTRRPDGRPETAADRRCFDLREAGYQGPITRDGYAVAAMTDDARRLTPEEITAAIAAGGYPPGAGPWPSARPADDCDDAPADRLADGPDQPDVRGTPMTNLIDIPRCRNCIELITPCDACWDRHHELPTGMEIVEARETGQSISEIRLAFAADQERIARDQAASWVFRNSTDARLRALAAAELRRLRGLPDPDHPTSPVGHPADGPDRPAPGRSTTTETTTPTTQEIPMSDSSTMTMTSRPGGTTVSGSTQVGGELTAVGDLRAEVASLTAYTETIQVMLQDLQQWAKSLPAQVMAAQWSTAGVTSAAVALAEATTVGQVREGITTLITEGRKAQRLGEILAAGGAQGRVSGLRPQ